jgi:hypothetical protein
MIGRSPFEFLSIAFKVPHRATSNGVLPNAPPKVHDNADDEKDQKHEEQNLGNSSGYKSNRAKAQQTSQNGDDQKD